MPPGSVASLRMDFLICSIVAMKISDTSTRPSVAMILENQGGMTGPAEMEIKEESSEEIESVSMDPCGAFVNRNDATGVEMLWFLPSILSILMI